MWIMTDRGFFSIVEKDWDRVQDTLTVRARVERDLDQLRLILPELGETVRDDGADYMFRAQAPKKAVAKALSIMVKGIDYDNFKDEVAHMQGNERASVYSRIWAILRTLQPTPKAFREYDLYDALFPNCPDPRD